MLVISILLLAAILMAPHCGVAPSVGFGAAAAGGQGYPVVLVTSLGDNGPYDPVIPGSLRAALSGGNRNVHFAVSGNIRLRHDLPVRHPHVTIDGSDAPNGGVALWDYTLVLETDNVVVRHLRFRGSHQGGEEKDGLAIGGGSNILIDHVSCSWATDECLSIYGYEYTGTGRVRNVTIQNSLIAEAPGSTSTGMLIDGDVANITWYRNVFAKNANRNPQITTGRRLDANGGGSYISAVARYELLQNVIYDSIYGTRIRNESPVWTIELDAIGNLWMPGPEDPSPKIPIMPLTNPMSLGPIRVFAKDNADPGRPGTTGQGCDVFSLESLNTPCGGWAPQHSANKRQVTTHALPEGRAVDDLEAILSRAGATLPCRDSADQRVIQEVRWSSGQRIASPYPLPNLSACP